MEFSLPEIMQNPFWVGYKCNVCDREYPPNYVGFVCQDCGVDGILDVAYDYAAISETVMQDLVQGAAFPPLGASGLWRFGTLLPMCPMNDHSAWTLGATAVHRPLRLAEHLGVADLVIKDDTCLPSGSLKDRAAAMAIAHARQLGIDHLACASTGNAAASLAVLSARAGMSCTIFVPQDAPKAKLAQLLLHGANVITVAGTYDQAFDLSIRHINENSWYSRNCAHNPLLVEGKKTAVLELMFSLTGGFRSAGEVLPDVIFVPVGDGCIVSSVAKGVLELQEIGLISKAPRVIGVQAKGASPLAAAWAKVGNQNLSGRQILDSISPVLPDTIADSISVGIPRNRVKAWQKVAALGGAFIAVSDQDIIEAIGLLAAKAGVFAEPSGATGLAGIKSALSQGLISATDKVAVLVTGNGLKDPEAGLGNIKIPTAVSPD